MHTYYFVPPPSIKPIFTAIALFCLAFGAGHWVHGLSLGPILVCVGFGLLFITMAFWFFKVIKENRLGCYNEKVNHSFIYGMKWFIFSEVCFFGLFFGAYFYFRLITLPMLGGTEFNYMTHILLWPNFLNEWPSLLAPAPQFYDQIRQAMTAFDFSAISGGITHFIFNNLALVNTLILITSSFIYHFSEMALKKNHRKLLIFGLILTVLLGLSFLTLQVHEYIHAYTHQNLTLNSAIYGSTFFLMTGFHGLHVTIGTIIIFFILLRCMRGHFTPNDHFGVNAAGWYWHFVDVVWIALFLIVYWW